MELKRNLVGDGDWPEFKNRTTGNISVVQWSENSHQHNCIVCGGALAAESFQPWYVNHENWCDHKTIVLMQHTKDIFWESVVKTHREMAASNKKVMEREKDSQ